ncbi:FimD/PapC C-terminal domain-containing protein [Siccibacter turicensis]
MRVAYVASVGVLILLTLINGKGKHIPFGAIATTTDNNMQGAIVGEPGLIYLSGMGNNDYLIFKGANLNQYSDIYGYCQKTR